MSSHREAPEIATDPVADSTDLYAFVSPDQPGAVTLIANYVPLENPAGGPNFYEFGDDVRYEIHIDNDADGFAEITYRFEFHTTLRDPDTFLYNTAPITSLTSESWNRRQFFRVSEVTHRGEKVLGANLPCPPCNIGPLSTPDYPALARQAVHDLPSGIRVFAGQRAEGFYVDLGSIFDLANLRPLQTLHEQYGMHVFSKPAPGVNATDHLNVHTIAVQVPTAQLTGASDRKPDDPRAVIGVWTTASRQRARIMDDRTGEKLASGPFTQVSRLGNPLVNEVLIALRDKDRWNRQPPADDKQFLSYVAHPELAGLLPALYPGVFPHLASLAASGKPRDDLVAILLTGIPPGLIAGFSNSTGPVLADMLRLNTAIPPSASPNVLGLLGGDLAGFPNGRRVSDDIVTVELRAVAGAVYPLVDPSYTPDAAVNAITDGLGPSSVNSPYLSGFPYLGVPYSGFYNPS
jgi:hypothetical protein